MRWSRGAETARVVVGVATAGVGGGRLGFRSPSSTAGDSPAALGGSATAAARQRARRGLRLLKRKLGL